MDLRQVGWWRRVPNGWGMASAFTVRLLTVRLLTVACLCLLPDVAGGGSVSSQRETPRLASGERNLVELGRRLFFEPILSSHGTNACASCHDPEHGFGDVRRFSPEDLGRTRRHSQALIDVDLKANQHWDGEFLSVAAIVAHRATQTGTPAGYGGESDSTPGRRSAREEASKVVITFDMEDDQAPRGEPSPEQDLGLAEGFEIPSPRPGIAPTNKRTGRSRRGVPFFLESSPGADGAERVVAHERYAEAIASVQSGTRPGRFDAALAGRAIEAYVGSLRSNRSAYDRYRAGEGEALSASALRGLGLFRGRAGCVACHKEAGPKDWPLFRDSDFHNSGIAWLSTRHDMVLAGAPRGAPPVTPKPGFDEGRGRFLPEAGYVRAFKTPSLRDVARHPPYMHDGSKATLEDVVAHYAAGCGDDPARDERLRGFVASDQDRQDLVAFLTALTSEERPGRVAEAWKKRVERTRVRFLDARGEPVVGFTLGLEEAGEKLPTERGARLPATIETDLRGEISYLVPGSTHVRLRLPRGVQPQGGTLIPDTCGSAEIVLPLSGLLRLALVVDDAQLATPDTLRAYEPLQGPPGFDSEPFFRPDPWTLTRKGVVAFGEQQAVLYEGYRLGAGHRSLVFRLPWQTAPQEVVLGSEALSVSTDATQRVDVLREGSSAWRERLERGPGVPTR